MPLCLEIENKVSSHHNIFTLCSCQPSHNQSCCLHSHYLRCSLNLPLIVLLSIYADMISYSSAYVLCLIDIQQLYHNQKHVPFLNRAIE